MHLIITPYRATLSLFFLSISPPLRLGKSTVMLTREVVAEAAGMARTKFIDRRTPMTFELYDEGTDEQLL